LSEVAIFVYMTITIKRKKTSFWEKLYLIEIIKGMFITGRHLISNIIRPSRMMTINYPEETKPIDEGYRSEHRLMQRKDGSIRCTACMLCATACPADCIHIEAAEGPHAKAEKYAKVYTIDHLRCVYCGLCVDACPCDAVRMDTQTPVDAFTKRDDFVRDINYLKDNHGDKDPVSEADYP
jgi:NADH-quinone oxidoreductase subunit I